MISLLQAPEVLGGFGLGTRVLDRATWISGLGSGAAGFGSRLKFFVAMREGIVLLYLTCSMIAPRYRGLRTCCIIVANV